MTDRNYWLDVFSPETWREFLDHGGNVSGNKENRWNTVKKFKKGDYFICYVTKISRFIGICEVTSEAAFKGTTTIWEGDEKYPCRVNVKVIAELDFDYAIPYKELGNKISYLRDHKENVWSTYFQNTPLLMEKTDGEAVLNAILEAEKNPVKRPVDQKKLVPKKKRKSQSLLEKTISAESMGEGEVTEVVRVSASHTEIQWRLLKLGSTMGLDVWVARNDRNKEYNGELFGNIQRMKETLPRQFDDATNKTIEHIDVLWLKGNAIIAAFEIEHTTQIFSGLLRMADLIAMQPNLNIPLYIVAPDERRKDVFKEINRPIFSSLKPPMNKMCKYISYSSLIEETSRASKYLQHMNPEFLKEIAVKCDLDNI